VVHARRYFGFRAGRICRPPPTGWTSIVKDQRCLEAFSQILRCGVSGYVQGFFSPQQSDLAPGFPVELGGFGRLHAPFLTERRTRRFLLLLGRKTGFGTPGLSRRFRFGIPSSLCTPCENALALRLMAAKRRWKRSALCVLCAATYSRLPKPAARWSRKRTRETFPWGEAMQLGRVVGRFCQRRLASCLP